MKKINRRDVLKATALLPLASIPFVHTAEASVASEAEPLPKYAAIGFVSYGDKDDNYLDTKQIHMTDFSDFDAEIIENHELTRDGVFLQALKRFHFVVMREPKIHERAKYKTIDRIDVYVDNKMQRSYINEFHGWTCLYSRAWCGEDSSRIRNSSVYESLCSHEILMEKKVNHSCTRKFKHPTFVSVRKQSSYPHCEQVGWNLIPVQDFIVNKDDDQIFSVYNESLKNVYADVFAANGSGVRKSTLLSSVFASVIDRQKENSRTYLSYRSICTTFKFKPTNENFEKYSYLLTPSWTAKFIVDEERLETIPTLYQPV